MATGSISNISYPKEVDLNKLSDFLVGFYENRISFVHTPVNYDYDQYMYHLKMHGDLDVSFNSVRTMENYYASFFDRVSGSTSYFLRITKVFLNGCCKGLFAVPGNIENEEHRKDFSYMLEYNSAPKQIEVMFKDPNDLQVYEKDFLLMYKLQQKSDITSE